MNDPADSKRRYKLLFADDEYWIRENFRNCVDWASYNIEFLDPAADGEEALAKVFALRPDVFVTDINMPFLNGTELIAEIRKNNTDLPVVVLSGYDDFQYVHDALIAGAGEYLLKPLDPRRILAVVQKSIQSIQELARKRGENDHLREQVAEAEIMLTDRRLSALVQPEGFEVFDSDGRADIPLPDLSTCWLILVNSTGRDVSVAREIIRSCFANRAISSFNNVYSPNEFIVLFDSRQSGRDAVCNKVISDFESGAVVRIGISRLLSSAEEIKKAYAEALSVIRSKPASLGSFRASIEEPGFEPARVRVSAAQASELELALRSCDWPRANDIIKNQIALNPDKINSWSWYELNDTVDRILRIARETCLLPEPFSEARIALENMVDMVRIAIDFRDSARVVELVDDIVSGLIERQPPAPGGDSMRNVIRFVRQYVTDHYFEDLSLALLSSRFHVEPTYLSRIFKKETGMNLVVYIARCRIEKAVEHIGSTDLSFSSVASLVGYDDYAYFNRVFRKITGMSPSEYREYVRAGGVGN